MVKAKRKGPENSSGPVSEAGPPAQVYPGVRQKPPLCPEQEPSQDAPPPCGTLPAHGGAPSGSKQQNYKQKAPSEHPGAGPSATWWGRATTHFPRLKPKPHVSCTGWATGSSLPLARFRGGRGGALEVLGAAGWVGVGLPLRMAPYVSFCKMLGAKLLCLSLARPAVSLAKDAALDPSW